LEFEKYQLLSADSLTLIVKTKRVCKLYNNYHRNLLQSKTVNKNKNIKNNLMSSIGY